MEKIVAFVELIDVMAVLSGAHEGKGLGNQFLDDLMQAKSFNTCY